MTTHSAIHSPVLHLLQFCLFRAFKFATSSRTTQKKIYIYIQKHIFIHIQIYMNNIKLNKTKGQQQTELKKCKNVGGKRKLVKKN